MAIDLPRAPKRYFTTHSCLQLNTQFNRNGIMTLGIELMPMAGGRMDVSRKLIWQCSIAELWQIARVLFKAQPEAHFSYHGTDNNKSLKVANSDKGAGGFAFMLRKGREVKYYQICTEMARIEVQAYIAYILEKNEQMSFEQVLLMCKHGG
ncbi:hypothetical protein LRP52_44880 [Photobacterium sp. ZSDE20]|uniref:Uncharacterized protein n=1 Tax=Photobacterium pectinilyticum TaxID=2906793 RepID=A0ABT1N8P1_9GAMM|nr:hypothetical protein [Photobacterium sp. ZSDE20]MCQ1061129.1 hypothetical protein [Photobacterium sp. ZSDE20]MDD1829302.1 hypothetical protein [Photobacterium sp. ZSDE20]